MGFEFKGSDLDPTLLSRVKIITNKNVIFFYTFFSPVSCWFIKVQYIYFLFNFYYFIFQFKINWLIFMGFPQFRNRLFKKSKNKNLKIHCKILIRTFWEVGSCHFLCRLKFHPCSRDKWLEISLFSPLLYRHRPVCVYNRGTPPTLESGQVGSLLLCQYYDRGPSPTLESGQVGSLLVC